MRTVFVFLTGVLIGSAIAAGVAQGSRIPGVNNMNHHFGLHVADVTAMVATLKARGVTVEDVRVRPDDSMVANVTDPGGLRIEMFQFGPGSLQGQAIASWK